MFLRTLEKQPDIVPNDILIFFLYSFKMAAAKPISLLVDQITMKFQRLPNVFGVRKHVEDTVDHFRCISMSEIQDGGRQTGSSYITACRPASNDQIPMATLMFSESGNTLRLLWTTSGVSTSLKSKMAATKQEVPISQLIPDSNEIVKVTLTIRVQVGDLNCADTNTAIYNQKSEKRWRHSNRKFNYLSL